MVPSEPPHLLLVSLCPFGLRRWRSDSDFGMVVRERNYRHIVWLVSRLDRSVTFMQTRLPR